MGLVELRMLGPIELYAGDRVWDVGPPQRRHVLAALAVDAGRLVSTETLIDRVWDEPPPGARRALHVHITHLRRLLGPAATLARRSGGYVLEVAPARVDLHRFRDLVRAGRSRGDVGLLREARSLWRGEPLAGLTGEWAARSRRAWQRWYVDATVAWAEAELAAHGPADMVGPLREMAGEYPLAEPLAAALLRALHAGGRSAEALEHYATVREYLAAELGTDPGPELQAVHQAILRGTPGRAPVPEQLPADVPGFAGREEYLSRLDKLVTRSTVVISVLSGMAGIGKTSLAVHWAHRVAEQFPDGQLYVNLRGFDPSGRVMDPADAVRGFLDALGVAPGEIPASPDAQAARYRGLLAGKRILILLDNARDAEQVRPLLPAGPTALTLVTSRNHLTGLLATDGAQPLDLDVLTAEESRDLLIERLGNDRVAAEPGAVQEIVAACAGLPLALSIAAARAQQTGFPLAALAAELNEAGHRLNALDTGDPPSDVRAVFSWSYETLTPPAARLFRLLGLHPGPDLSTAAAASLAGLPVPGTRRLLTQLARANLAVEHLPGRYTQHDLLRAYAADLASADDTGDALARLIAHYTHTACAASRLIHPTLNPIAVPLGPLPDGAGVAHLADHPEAMAWLAAEHANLLAAVACAAGAGLHTCTWQLAWGLDTFHYRQSHLRDQVMTWQTAVAAAHRVGTPSVRAYTHRRLGEAYRRLGRAADASVQAQEALHIFDRIGDRYGEINVRLDLSMLAEHKGDLEEALGHAEQALAAARAGAAASGERFEPPLARALNTVGWFHALLGDPAPALAFCQEALALNQRLGEEESMAMTLDSIAYAHRQLGQHGQAVESYERSLALFRRLGDAYMTAHTLDGLGDTHRDAGHAEPARASWTEALRILTELGHESAEKVRAKLRTH
jgi:DNA-binding SARP family transcriptional activator/tetratricopeptide (TPR) repeat protein